MSIWCLHGNLQLPSTWNAFHNQWTCTDASGNRSVIPLICPNFWQQKNPDFTTWSSRFCKSVSETPTQMPRWLMGYSMGGRLALHAAIQCPTLFKGVIVIGAHPGLPSDRERSRQHVADQQWAKRFRTENWTTLLKAWDALPVFCGKPNTLPRSEASFSREQLAFSFEQFSKAKQAYLPPKLATLRYPPVLFLSGEEDLKYRAIGDQLAANCPMINHVTVPNAGHRVPWENPAAFIKIIQVFLDNTS